MAEQRVIGQRIGARPATPAAPATTQTTDLPAPEPARRRGPRRLVVVLVAVVLAGAAVAGWYLLAGRPRPSAPQATPTAVAGEVVTVDPVSVNLSGGHYLRLGMAIQLSADIKKAPDTSRAIDLAISLYSGRSVDDVSAAASRDSLKAQLVQQLQQAYGAGVMDVYLTDYVTQ